MTGDLRTELERQTGFRCGQTVRVVLAPGVFGGYSGQLVDLAVRFDGVVCALVKIEDGNVAIVNVAFVVHEKPAETVP